MDHAPLGRMQAALSGLHEQQLYAVVDLAACPDARMRITGSARPAQAQCLLPASAGAGAQDAAPWLIGLGSAPAAAGSSRLRKCFAVAESAPAVVWVTSPLALDDLAARLTQRFNVVLSGEQAMVLRWHDPRILPELDAALSPEQRAAFFAVGTQAWWLERGVELRCIDLAGALHQDPLDGALRLTPPQEDRLMWVSEREQFLVELAARRQDALHAHAPLQRARWVEQWMQLAQRNGLQSHADQLVLMCLALTHGDDVLQQPRWHDVWPLVAQGQISLLDAVARCESGATA